MKTIEEKISELRKHYKHPDDQQLLDSWEKRLTGLYLKADWQQHQETRELAENARREVIRINTILAEKEDLSELERRILFAKKEVQLYYLAVFAEDIEKEIELIEKGVENDLIKIK